LLFGAAESSIALWRLWPGHSNHQLLVRGLWPPLLGLGCGTHLHTQQPASVAQRQRNGKMYRTEKDLEKFAPFPISPPPQIKVI